MKKDASTANTISGQMAPTPRPWRVIHDFEHPGNLRITSEKRPHVAKIYAESWSIDPTAKANAELICRAVNNFDALVEALNGLIKIADHIDLGQGLKLGRIFAKEFGKALIAAEKAGEAP